VGVDSRCGCASSLLAFFSPQSVGMGGCCCSSKTVISPIPLRLSSIGSVTSSDEDIRDKYDLGALLGSGSFGQVREATTKDPPFHVRAVKMIERDNEDGEWSNQAIFMREVGLLQDIQHENIIQYFDVYEDHHFLYVVMELCRGGEVFAKIIELKRFSERHAAMLGQQMLAAIEYIHDLQIVHRDIKAENFMLSEPEWPSTVKMIDFGMACKIKEGQVLTELCGSPHYLAPELIGKKYNELVDVWAFGVLLYLLMYGRYPYDAKHTRDIMAKIVSENIRWQTKVKLSDDAVSFLKQLLEHDPKKRLTAVEALSHPWMASEGSPDVSDQTRTLPSEVVRSAHKKVTATRKQVDPKVEEVRNEKLRKIDEDYNNGIRNGQRLHKTENEDFMRKPEFLRRDNRITTSPSDQLRNRRVSLDRMLGRRRTSSPCTQSTLEESTSPKSASAANSRRGDRRAQSMTAAPAARRFSYISNKSKTQEEAKAPAAASDEKRRRIPGIPKAMQGNKVHEFSAIGPA